MQHYQVPSAEYSSYINHVISLGLAEDYIAQLCASCSPNSPPPLRAAIDQACRHLSGVVDDLQPVDYHLRYYSVLDKQSHVARFGKGPMSIPVCIAQLCSGQW